MKYLIILADGMADEPIEQLGGMTPTQYAETPHIDQLASKSRMGMYNTVPAGFHPGSEIANLTVMGYDVAKVFEGRASLEAASMGIDIEPGELSLRCNLICIENGKIKNHSAGHISNEEADELIKFLQKELGSETVNFFTGVSYRHLLKIKGGIKNVKCTPPHDVPGAPSADVMISANDSESENTANLLNELILKSQVLLENHPVNLKRATQGKDKANSIWPWSPGYKPTMLTLKEVYGIKSGAVISAVDLIRGIGVYAGLEVIEVEGATGLYDTNYEGKAQAAIEALRKHDFVYLHIEASDEAGHEGNVDLKVKTVEYLDKRIVKTIMNEISTWDEPVRVALLPDHPTPCALRTHTHKPIPFLIFDPNTKGDGIATYDEFSAQNGSYGLIQGDEFMQLLIEK